MPNRTRLSRLGLVASGAVMTYLAPKLAMDAKVEIAPVFSGITSKNFGDKRGVVTERLRKLTAGKLAQDASLEDLTQLLDTLEAHSDEVADEDETAGATDPSNKLRSFLQDKLSPEDMAACDEMMGGGKEEAEDEDAAEKRDNESEGENLAAREAREHAEDEEEEMPVSKQAMDAAIKSAVNSERKRAANLRAAEDAVYPYVGKLAVACDSADEVYRRSLEILGVDGVDQIHPSALPTILKMQPLPGSTRAPSRPAMDSATSGGFFERFPEAKTNPVRAV